MPPTLHSIRSPCVRLATAISLILLVGQQCGAASLVRESSAQDGSQGVPAFMVRLLTADDVAGKTPTDLELMRNEIFARLGRRFERADLQAYFDSQPWYRPRFAASEFDANLLSAVQKQNVAILRAAERRARRASPVDRTAKVSPVKPAVSARQGEPPDITGVSRTSPGQRAIDPAGQSVARPARGELVLDKLTACSDIARVYEALKAQPRVALSECRPPRDGLESVLASRSGAGASQLCFLRTSPAAFLDSFSCVRFITNTATNAAEVTCLRAASLRDIQSYKAQYAERFAVIESQYLVAAQRCQVGGGGDTANSAPVLFPPVASMLARFQLGFSASLGPGRPAASSIFHGYGETDPEIGPRMPSAIEVVAVIVNSPARHSVPKSSRTVGDWVLQVEDTTAFEKEVNERYARAAPTMRFNVIGYTLARDGQHGMTASSKLSFTDGLHDSIVEDFEGDGFEQLSDRELRRQTGKSSEELAREVSRNSTPFGGRDHSVKLSSSFRMLLKETGLSCTRRGRGAVAAYLMGTQPSAGVQRDFGDILLMVARMGACADSSEARSYVEELLEKSTEVIVGSLGR
jgi:hypothetical protein